MAPTGGTIKLTDTIIVTTGSNAEGVNTNSGGMTTITGGSVTTSGNGAIGLFAHGAGSTITASGVAVTTSGGFSTATSTFANGIVAVTGARRNLFRWLDHARRQGGDAAVGDGGGLVNLSGTTISTTGNGSADWASTARGPKSSLPLTSTDGRRHDPVTGATLHRDRNARSTT